MLQEPAEIICHACFFNDPFWGSFPYLWQNKWICILTVTGRLAYTEAPSPSYMYMPANVLHLVRAFFISESAFQNPLVKLFTCSRMKLLQALHMVKRLKECLKLYKTVHAWCAHVQIMWVDYMNKIKVVYFVSDNRLNDAVIPQYNTLSKTFRSKTRVQNRRFNVKIENLLDIKYPGQEKKWGW